MRGKQVEELLDAICAAYDQATFDRMLRFALDKDRERLVEPGSLRAPN